MSAGSAALAATATASAQRYGSGQSVRRVEDPALVQGLGRFTDDVSLPGQCWLAFVRSDRPHARIRSIDTTAARAAAGVVAVFTGADLEAAGVRVLPFVGGPFLHPNGAAASAQPKQPLARGVVRHVGEIVVAVVAESQAAARDAAALVGVDYDDLGVVSNVHAALQADAPQVWPGAPGNVVAQVRYGDAAAVDRAFAQAAQRVAVDIDNQRLSPVSLEPRSVLAYLDGADAGTRGPGRLTLRLSSQMPTSVRAGVAAALPGLAEADVRVVVGDVGGGFGMKTGAYPEDVVVAHAARATGRPVKWQGDRLEEFLSAVHGRDQVSRAEMALDAQGRVLAVRVRTWANVGACPSTTSLVIPFGVGPWVLSSIYDVPLVQVHVQAVLTHQTPTGAYRGAGRPENIYLMERLMDAAARAMGVDAAELRRRNMVRPEQMPYTNPMGQVYDCGAFAHMLDAGLALADWAGFAQRRAATQARGRLRGRGIATFLEWTGGNALTEQVQVRIVGGAPGQGAGQSTAQSEGWIELTSATMAMGQGIVTSYVQLAHDVFGVPLDRIRVLQGDTDRANGFGSAGSRSLFTGGAAVRAASVKGLDSARDLAAEALEVPAADLAYTAGRFVVAGTDLGIGLFQLAARQASGDILASDGATAGGPSWPNGCHICEVEIDPETGSVHVERYASVNDIGRVVSPTIVRGQVEGGAMQGIGQALMEQVRYDADSGQLLTASFMDYALPRVDDAPVFNTVFDESVPCRTNALGVKGVGELGTIGATPAVVNAVIDALAHVGQGAAAQQVQMPLTPERVWQALRGVYPPQPGAGLDGRMSVWAQPL